MPSDQDISKRINSRTARVLDDDHLRATAVKNASALNHQYAAAWVRDLDALTGGKLGRYATDAQIRTLTETVASATARGVEMEDLKAPYANGFNPGMWGRKADEAITRLTDGIRSTAGNDVPMDATGSYVSLNDPVFLPRVAAGQDADLRASVATDLGVPLLPNGEFVSARTGGFPEPTQTSFGARQVDNTLFADDSVTLPPSSVEPLPAPQQPAPTAASLPPGIFGVGLADSLRHAQEHGSQRREAGQTSQPAFGLGTSSGPSM